MIQPANHRTLFRKVLFVLVSSALLIACKSSRNLQTIAEVNMEINAASPVDTALSNMILPYQIEMQALMSEVLNVAEVDLIKGRPESNLGNLIADLSMDVGGKLYQAEVGESIDFCLLNEGGMRGSIAQGPISLGNVFELMPFENELVVITLSYDKTMEIFDYLVVSGGEPISNAELVIKDEKPYSVLINGQVPDSTRNYRILTTDYLARGGDKMYFFIDPINYEKVGVKLRDAIILYLEDQALEGEEIYSSKDGRIRYE
jgi:2',3'-cyclic-nucleotide 2'-phosphodiesterase (5'-nucleotidase family)